jgi:5'-deoxynucleotidase YfbR-like HD superfamily hydrolase
MTTQTAAIDRYSNRFTSLFERMGIRMVFHLIAFQGIMTAFSALWDWFTKLTDAEQRATDKLDAYNSALKETAKLSGQIESQIAGGIAFDGSKAQIALKIANDQTKSIRERILAYQDLQSIMPNIFQSLTDEQKKTGEFTADMDKANTAIRLQNELKAANDVLESKSKALAISRGTLGQFEKNYIDSQDPNNSKNFNPTKYKNEFINAQLEQAPANRSGGAKGYI